MVFDLAINVNAFPKCNRCKNDMVLARVVEIETISTENPSERGISFSASHSTKDEREQKASDSVIFIWKCSCGNVIEDKLD